LYLFVYTRVKAKNDTRKIWVPPKKPQLPFGLGPPEEKLKPEDFEETTYLDYEIKQLKEAAQQMLTGVAISFFMGMQFKVYMSFLIQSVSTPMAVFDNAVFKKYVLGVTKGDNGAELYNEFLKKPTVESLAVAERLAAARAAGVGEEQTPAVEAKSEEKKSKLTASVARSAIPANEPRVEELPADE
jgi:hypothetical protein